MKARIVSFWLAVCLCATTLVGCGGSSAPATQNTPEPTPSAADDPPVSAEVNNILIGIVADDASEYDQESEAIALFKENGIDYESYQDPKYIIAEATADTAYDRGIMFVEEEYDVIIYTAKGSAAAAESLVAKCSDTGVDIDIIITEAAKVVTPEIEIDWTEAVVPLSNADGYTYEMTYRLSPWIFVSDANTDVLETAWVEAGGDPNSFPGFDDWGFTYSNNVYKRPVPYMLGRSTQYFARMTDMYYCIGTVEVKNTTEGWSINSDNPHSIYMGLDWTTDRDYFHDMYPGWPIGRAFYTGQTADKYGGLNYLTASMKSDYWGKLPVIIMMPENLSPKYPDGEYEEALINGHFMTGFGNYPSIYLGIISKDGEYTPPISEE